MEKEFKYRGLLRIPDRYDTVEKKLAWLNEESLKEKNRDRMEQDHTFDLYRTKEYWKKQLKKTQENDQIDKEAN